jgi:hypothetical protein
MQKQALMLEAATPMSLCVEFFGRWRGNIRIGAGEAPASNR